MSDTSKIEWTDATWNPVTGCTKVSPGCAHCYAETFAERWRGTPGHYYERGFDIQLRPEKLDEPLRWKKPRRVFVNSMSDLLHEDVLDEFIDRVFAVMALTPWHTYQVLTKRPERMQAYLTDDGRNDPMSWWQGEGMAPERLWPNRGSKVLWAAQVYCDTAPPGTRARVDYPSGDTMIWPLPNVWLGVSVENQHWADERIPLLLQTPAAVRFLSCEPLLGPVDLHLMHKRGVPCTEDPPRQFFHADYCAIWPQISWVIVGGESGPQARPMDLAWARSIVEQCRAAGVPVFVKQLGSAHRCPHSSKGGCQDCMPEDLRVREFPA